MLPRTPDVGPPTRRRSAVAAALRAFTRGAAAVVVAAAAALAGAIFYVARGARLPVQSAHVLYPDQGWGSGVDAPARQAFYYTPQGASLKGLRYRWFVHLELPFSRTRLADAAVMRGFGFVVDGPSPANPDGLPVGFTRRFDAELGADLLDITCAACHTGQIEYTAGGRTTAIRIDGGSATHAFTDAGPGHFVPTLLASLVSTASNPLKFERFAARALDRLDLRSRAALHRGLREVIGTLVRMRVAELRHGLVPTPEGYGRTDALARISNEVFAYHLDPGNFDVGDAPVNFPPIWNAWKLDRVQYNASVGQPMARNIGEAMGTGARYSLVDGTGAPIPRHERYRSSALLRNLHAIETGLRRLRPPAWPEEVLGRIDRERAVRGKALFDEHCLHCHGPFPAPPALKARNAPLKTAAEPEWIVGTVCVEDVGTDRNTAVNFAGATVDLTKAGITRGDLQDLVRAALGSWKARQQAYLTGEIRRLLAELDGSRPPSRARGTDALALIAAHDEELARLDGALERQLAAVDPQRVPVGLALSYLGTMIRERTYDDMRLSPDERAELDGFGTLDIPQVIAAYKPRPLAGIWATPPYLHNGSVPTIYHLLSPVGDRPTVFRVGSREYDPVRLGLAPADERFMLFDTRLDGNGNGGHEFAGEWAPRSEARGGRVGRYLTPDERLAIIEHLKARDDDADGAPEGQLPVTARCGPATPEAVDGPA